MTFKNTCNEQVHFVVVSSDKSRKEIMQKQFTDLELDSVFDIHYEEAITVDNSPYALIPRYPPFPETKETLCCFLSHIKAMKWYLKNCNYPYLLLLEDDCAIQKINFKQNLLQLIPQLEKKEFDYISLGYHIKTISNDFLKNPLIKKHENVYWNLYKYYLHTTWGTQAQLFPRSVIEFYLSIYDKSSTQEIHQSICSYLDKNEFYYANPPRLQIDYLNGLLKHQAIAFPPLVIELNDVRSTINKMTYTKKLWQEGAIRKLYKLNDYYSYDKKDDNLILNHELRKTERNIPDEGIYGMGINFTPAIFNIFRNSIEVTCRFGSSTCDKFLSRLSFLKGLIK